MTDEWDFEAFLAEAQPRLRRAFVAARGVEGAADATAEALAWAWEHRERLRRMENPFGYLYRVGQSRTRARRAPVLPPPESLGIPDVEPALVPALLDLPERQRAAVWLVHACQWQYQEVAEALGISASAVGTHVTRALAHLRDRLGVETSA